MSLIFRLFKTDLRKLIINSPFIWLLTLASNLVLLFGYFLFRLVGLRLDLFLPATLWAIVFVTALVVILPVVYRDYRHGLVRLYALAGTHPFRYYLVRTVIGLLYLLAPVITLTLVLFFLLDLSSAAAILLFILLILKSLAIINLSIWIIGLTAPFSWQFFLVVIAPFIVPQLIAGIYLFRLMFDPAGVYPGAWIYWLISYIFILICGIWLSADFIWEEL